MHAQQKQPQEAGDVTGFNELPRAAAQRRSSCAT